MVCFLFSLAPEPLCLQSVMGKQSVEEVEKEASVCGEGRRVEAAYQQPREGPGFHKNPPTVTCGPVARGDKADLRAGFLARGLEVESRSTCLL